MAMARTLLLLIGVLAVLVLGASAPARAEAAVQPCHPMSAAHPDAATPLAPTPGPGKAPAMAAMACCAACVPAPAPVPNRVPTPAAAPAGKAFIATAALPRGLSPAPEPGPPRL
jgi:hypothetical protein